MATSFAAPSGLPGTRHNVGREYAGQLPPALRLFCATLVGLWILAVAVALIESYGFGLGPSHWYPFYFYNSPLDSKFMDFSYFAPIAPRLHKAAFFHQPGFSYPAPLAFVFEFFYQFGRGDMPLQVFLGFTCLIFLVGAILLIRALQRRGMSGWLATGVVALTSLLAYPAMFLFERGNIESVCWMFLALGVAAYWKERWYLAAICFGLAGSLKLFPAILLALLLSSRKYHAFAVGIATLVGTILVSIWALGPTFQIASSGMANGLAAFRRTNILPIRPHEIGFDHSLFGLVKLVFHTQYPRATLAEMVGVLGSCLSVYMLAGAVLGLALYVWKIRPLPRTNQLIALTVACILLPPVSFVYTLVHLYPAFAAVVLHVVRRTSASAATMRGVSWMMVCFALLFAPEAYVRFNGARAAGQFTALVLVMLFIAALRYPLHDEQTNTGILRSAQDDNDVSRWRLARS